MGEIIKCRVGNRRILGELDLKNKDVHNFLIENQHDSVVFQT